MAHHSFYSHALHARDDSTEFEPIRPSPLSETVPFFGAGARSSTWPMSSNGFHDVDSDYTVDEDDGGVDNQAQNAELEVSNVGSTEPCEYDQAASF